MVEIDMPPRLEKCPPECDQGKHHLVQDYILWKDGCWEKVKVCALCGEPFIDVFTISITPKLLLNDIDLVRELLQKERQKKKEEEGE